MAKKITYDTDEGNKETEELLKELEKKINRQYSKASKEVGDKLQDYLERYEKKNQTRLDYLDDMKAKYDAKEISWNEYKKAKDEYTKWRIGQVAIGERWEELRDSLSQDLANTSNICRSMTEGYMCEAYALNHNYGTYLVESASRVDTSYTLYNRSAVERLVRKEPQILPMMSDKTKQRILTQKLEVWNGQKLTSALTQGILQGESIPKIAERFRGVAEMDYKQSIRTARTSMTSAQNGGRLDSFNRASDMGLKMKKQWVATIDDRTRHEHRMLDGQKVELDEPFEVDGYELMYPADPSGEPEMVYNCRCAMISIFDGYDKSITDYDIDDRLGDMTYDEWKESRDIKSDPIDKQERQGESIRQQYINEYKEMAKEADGDENKNHWTPEEIEQKYGVSVDISKAGDYQEEAEKNVSALGGLLGEYNSTIVSYSIVTTAQDAQEGGGAYMINGKTSVTVGIKSLKNIKATDALGLGDNQYLGTTYHEFAHTLSQSREKIDKDFWKEMRALRKDYQNQINSSEWFKGVRISPYASKDVDEFMAEAFTQAKLGKNPSEYSIKALEIIDKYYKKK